MVYLIFYDLTSSADSATTNNYLDSKIKDIYTEQPNEIFDFSFEKKLKNTSLGIGGKLSEEFLSKFEIEKDVFIFELNLDVLKILKVKKKEFHSILKYPKVLRDFAFILDKDISYKNCCWNNEKIIVQNLLRKMSNYLIYI